jgi:hypothetical protein
MNKQFGQKNKRIARCIFAASFLFYSSSCFAQLPSKKFDITFQLIAEVKNINKPCMPCGRIGNHKIDSINQKLGIALCNKVRISKRPARYKYFIKFDTPKNMADIIVLYQQTNLMKNISIYDNP